MMGLPITLDTSSKTWDDAVVGKFCYYGNTTNADSIKKYGALYNWYTVDTKKLAPTGWSVPTDANWDTLRNYLIANGYNWDGTTKDNKIAKSIAAKIAWNTSATLGAIGNDLTKNNKSGFSTLPGGCRFEVGLFSYLGLQGFWWSATKIESDPNYRGLGSDGIGIFKFSESESYGFSVRLIRNLD